MDAAADAIAAACRDLGITDAVVVAHDLHGPLASRLASGAPDVAAAALWADSDAAIGWARTQVGPHDLAPTPDGRHLTGLFAHLRDRHLLDPAEVAAPRRDGPPLPDPDEMHETVIAAAIRPAQYVRQWQEGLSAVSTMAAGDDLVRPGDGAELLSELERLRRDRTTVTPAPPTTEARLGLGGGDMRRAYVQTPSGRVHLRYAGGGQRTLLVLHSAPGGAGPIESVVTGLAHGRTVIAPDFLGNGDSDARIANVDIALLAHEMLELLDTLEVDQVDLWGTHTGACIAIELAVSVPDRVGRVVLEAPPLLDAAFTADILDNYLPPLEPDRWGLHLQQAWNMRRDMFLFWPWYRDQRPAMRTLGVPPVDVLHDWTLGLLSSGRTYHLSYRAAFENDTAAKLARLTRPTMVTAGPADMLAEGLEQAQALAPPGTVVQPTPATVWYPGHTPTEINTTLAIYDEFLRGA